jgi:hypothetical protein
LSALVICSIKRILLFLRLFIVDICGFGGSISKIREEFSDIVEEKVAICE